MPRTCTICNHPQREEIDAALLEGEPYRHIAARFDTSTGALQRHKEHLPSFIVKAHEAAEVIEAGTLLDRLKDLNQETRAILKETREAKDNELALKALARLEKQLELEGKLLGELNEGTTINVYTTPEWLALRAVVITALRPYPEAARAVGRALSDTQG